MIPPSERLLQSQEVAYDTGTESAMSRCVPLERSLLEQGSLTMGPRPDLDVARHEARYDVAWCFFLVNGNASAGVVTS